jgi:ABC-type taurine transport system substrate-binding protein
MPRKSVITQKKRGPPATGKGELIGVRIQPSLMQNLDVWIAKQEVAVSRPEAIRRLVEQALASFTKRHSRREAARKLAARAIEGLANKSLPTAEQEERKRKLIRGPREFRDIRRDQPKTKS